MTQNSVYQIVCDVGTIGRCVGSENSFEVLGKLPAQTEETDEGPSHPRQLFSRRGPGCTHVASRCFILDLNYCFVELSLPLFFFFLFFGVCGFLIF